MTTASARPSSIQENAAAPGPTQNPSGRLLIALWSVSVLGFAALAAASVTRLTNYNAGDIDLSGWTGPIATRLTAGERPYVDFVTPLGPGSLLLRSALERWSGELRLIDELGLVAGCRFLLAGLSYAIAITVTSRVTASLVAIGTLALLLGSSRDNAFEVLGQLGIWASLACAAHAWRAAAPVRGRFWLAAGVCSALTLGFESRSAVAGIVAWLLTLGILALRAQRLRADFGAWGRGVAVGLVLVTALVFVCRSTPSAFFQSVLSDGLNFAGGLALYIWAPLRSALSKEAYSSSLLLTAGSALLAAGLLAKDTTPAEPPHSEKHAHSAERAAILGALLVVSVALSSAVAALSFGVRVLPQYLLMVSLQAGAITGIGVVLGCLYSVWQARSRIIGEPDKPQTLALCFVFSLLATLLRDPWLFGIKPDYGGDVLTAVSMTFVFLAAERTGKNFARPLVLALVLLGLFGLKYSRALDASTLVRAGYWSKLHVNHRGLELLAAARRVHELTGPEDTVLVLPEDPQIAALIGRSRPRLAGSLVFSSQYPARLLEHDRAELEQRPPRVIVIHPRRTEHWQPWLAAFSPHAAATVLSLYVSISLLPKRYRLDSSFRTTYVVDQGALDVWVLDAGKTPAKRRPP